MTAVPTSAIITSKQAQLLSTSIDIVNSLHTNSHQHTRLTSTSSIHQPQTTTAIKMSASAAYFVAHDAHHPDSQVAEASHSRRSSLNPFHRKSASAVPETQPERRRSSVVEFAKKVGRAVSNEVKDTQHAFEVYYGVPPQTRGSERRASGLAA